MNTIDQLSINERASLAREVLHHPMLAWAFDYLEQELIEEWKISLNAAQRETCYLKWDALRTLRNKLRSILYDEKLAGHRHAKEQH